jgi:hypothetical protein
MPQVSVFFTFSQRFGFPAVEAFRWATDYRPQDIELMGKRGRRRITRVCNDTYVLTDTFLKEGGGSVSKRKLVRVYPERLAWTNTHLTGPNRHSQFLYEVLPDGKNASRLLFTGQQIETVETIADRQVRALAARIRKEDAAAWKNLARAMAADLGPRAGL